MYKLRLYQQQAVDSTLAHFRKSRQPALIVLPTGAGKSLVIAELARLAKGRVLVLAHVKELVEQNHAKFESYGLEAGIYSAGLCRKDVSEKVIFGSIQSVARAVNEIFKDISILIIDEAHRVSDDEESQYFQVINKLKSLNPKVCILGLTATPFRLGLGWIYEYNYKGEIKTEKERFFKKCIYELSLKYMIKNKFLTEPVKINTPVTHYDFSSLNLKSVTTSFNVNEIETILKDQSKLTPIIIQNIVDIAKDRQGVMIFTSSVRHAEEVLEHLPKDKSEIVLGGTEISKRDEIISKFKNKELKYLVNVSVLTTGFDAPHVDLIAILRPTESVSLYQQIVGRGLRLAEGKEDCLILDYTGIVHNLFLPEIGEDKPREDTVPVDVECPKCGFVNNFWGIVDMDGDVVEHFGRKCKGGVEDSSTGKIVKCGYLFRFKLCDACGAENDLSAKACSKCNQVLVDNVEKVQQAMKLKDAFVLRPDTMTFEEGVDKRGNARLEIKYYDLDAKYLTEYFYLNNQNQRKAFYYNFTRFHNKLPEKRLNIQRVDDVIDFKHKFRMPMFVIARKNQKWWKVTEKVFE